MSKLTLFHPNTPTQGFPNFMEQEQVFVRIGSARAVEGSKADPPARMMSGTITSSGSSHGQQKIIAPLPAGQLNDDTISLPKALVCPIPAVTSTREALRIACSFPFARALFKKHFTLQANSLNEATQVPSSKPSCLLTAGETATTAILSLLIRAAVPEARIFATVELTDHDDLVQRTGNYPIALGAYYAIDAVAEDLIHHLEAGLEGYTGSKKFGSLIDVNGFCDRRPELRSLLADDGIFVDGSAVGVHLDSQSELQTVMEDLRTLMEEHPSQLTAIWPSRIVAAPSSSFPLLRVTTPVPGPLYRSSPFSTFHSSPNIPPFQSNHLRGCSSTAEQPRSKSTVSKHLPPTSASTPSKVFRGHSDGGAPFKECPTEALTVCSQELVRYLLEAVLAFLQETR